MKVERKLVRFIIITVLLPLSLTAVFAQSTDDVNSAIQFNFSNPGARSLALGGAFTARADDATAVYANPAGLVQLQRFEASVDVRYWDYANRFLDSGDQVATGSLEGLNYSETDDAVAGLSFLSFMYPSKSGRWVLGGFRHEVANFETTIQSQGANLVGGSFTRPIDADFELNIVSVGVSFAGEVTRNLSLGGTATFSTFELESRTDRYNALRSDPSARVILFETQNGDDDDVTGSIGLLWRSTKTKGGQPLYSLGLIYRQGPEFEFEGSSSVIADNGTVFPRQNLADLILPPWPGTFKVPDVYGFGFSVRPIDRWLIAVDVSQVEYSDLLEEMLDIQGVDGPISNLTEDLGRVVSPEFFELDDGTEYRIGTEYAFVPESAYPTFFLRGGLWLDPDHEIRYLTAKQGAVPTLGPVWSPGDDELHYAAGMGLRFKDVQVDLALDLSERVNTLSLSAVFFFGRD